jgi:hypothetical protein
LRLCRIPAAEILDRDKVHGGKAIGELRPDSGIARPVVVVADDGLRRGGVEEFEIGGGGGLRALLFHDRVHHGDGRLGQDADGRIDDLEIVGAKLGLRQPCLVLPGDQHIAEAALGETVGGAARAGVEQRHMVQQVAHESLGRGVGGARLALGPGEGGEEVPARAARGLRVGRDDRDIGAHQIGPIADGFRIAGADEEHDSAGVGGGVVGQPGLPVRAEQPAPGQGVDIGGERQRHDIGLQSFQHGAGLRAGAAMRHVHRDGVARLAAPRGGEGRIDVAIELAGRVVGHVEQRDIGCGGAAGEAKHRQPAGEGRAACE